MALTPTFPTRGAAQRKFGFSPFDVVVGLALFLLVFAFIRVGRGATVTLIPSKLSSLDTSPINLPYYAARSLLRMFAALFLSVIFSLAYAYAAAHNRRLRRILLPALDIHAFGIHHFQSSRSPFRDQTTPRMMNEPSTIQPCVTRRE
jgi:hypothetical protein